MLYAQWRKKMNDASYRLLYRKELRLALVMASEIRSLVHDTKEGC
jgi:hypothetical protein